MKERLVKFSTIYNKKVYNKVKNYRTSNKFYYSILKLDKTPVQKDRTKVAETLQYEEKSILLKHTLNRDYLKPNE